MRLLEWGVENLDESIRKNQHYLLLCHDQPDFLSPPSASKDKYPLFYHENGGLHNEFVVTHEKKKGLICRKGARGIDHSLSLSLSRRVPVSAFSVNHNWIRPGIRAYASFNAKLRTV